MLDIKLLRDQPDVVRADLEKRGRDASVVDEVRRLDQAWRDGLQRVNEMRAERNRASKEMGRLRGIAKQLHQADVQFIEAVKRFEPRWTELKPRFHGSSAPSKSDVGELFQALGDYFAAWRALLDKAPLVREFLHEHDEFAATLGMTLKPDERHEVVLQLERLESLEKTIARAFQPLQQVSEPSRSDPMESEQARTYLGQATKAMTECLEVLGNLDPRDTKSMNAIQRNVSSLVNRLFHGLRMHSQRLKDVEAGVEQAEADRDTLLRSLPNVMHGSVPVGADDEDNVELRRWNPDGGDAPPVHPFEAVSHVDLLESLDLADLERAARAAGARFYYAKGDLVMLGRALEFYALQSLQERGFTPVEPPYMLRREAVEGAVDLADFEDVIYRVEAGKAAEGPEGKAARGEATELFLIATSEHPLAAMHMGEILDVNELPIKYAGVSPCFRKEAGAHGKDQKGIFRVHQFSKVEQFVYCAPEDSWDVHEGLLQNAEDLYQALGIPHRVVTICTGDLGTVAAKKYDIEAWMPVQGAYREVVSCSNCTDYQARRYGTRYFPKGEEKTTPVHTLNSTAIAVQRTLVAILENFQNEDGSVTVPEVLRPYLGGKARITPA